MADDLRTLAAAQHTAADVACDGVPATPSTNDDQQLRSVLESIRQIEASLKQKQRDEKAIKWITLTGTIVSTVVISGLTAFATYQLGQQSQTLQQAVAAQGQIHDLSSEDSNVRYGAEHFLAQTRYGDLVVRQATEFGDIDSIRELGINATESGMRQKYKDAETLLLREMEEDKNCFAGEWQQNDVDKGILRDFIVQIVSPRRLSVYRGGNDGGFYVLARKVGKNLWLDPDFSYFTNRGKLEWTTSDDCSFLDSNWGWHLQKKSTSTSAATTDTKSSDRRPRE